MNPWTFQFQIGRNWLILGAIVWVLFHFYGCGVVSSDGRGRVSVSRCDVIVGDELGELAPDHGGPRSRASYGNGIECRIVRF